MQSQVRFKRAPKKVPEKVLGGFGAEPGQVQQVPDKLWEVLVQSQVRFNRVPEKRSGRLWCRARSSSTGFRRRFQRRFREALVQSRIRFNRVPEKVEKKLYI